MGYAPGKHAYGICDKTGFRYKLNDLVWEYRDGQKTGFRVGRDVVDPDHPQNFLGRVKINDPQALRNPRPNRVEPYIVYVGVPNWEDLDTKQIIAFARLDSVAVFTITFANVSSVSATASVGNVVVFADGNVYPSGASSSASSGSVDVLPSIDVQLVNVTGFGEVSPINAGGDGLAPVIYDAPSYGELAWSDETWAIRQQYLTFSALEKLVLSLLW